LLKKLESIKIEKFEDKTSITPITKEVRIILEAFGIKIT
jgi:hypothetical protein